MEMAAGAGGGRGGGGGAGGGGGGAGGGGWEREREREREGERGREDSTRERGEGEGRRGGDTVVEGVEDIRGRGRGEIQAQHVCERGKNKILPGVYYLFLKEKKKEERAEGEEVAEKKEKSRA